MKRNETKRNKTKQNETKQNGTKQNRTERNEISIKANFDLQPGRKFHVSHAKGFGNYTHTCLYQIYHTYISERPLLDAEVIFFVTL